MSMRIFSLGSLLALSACGVQPAGEKPSGEAIACALDDAPEFADVCTLERSGAEVVVHRPDGGFRRFAASAEGFAPIDGAVEAEKGNKCLKRQGFHGFSTREVTSGQRVCSLLG